MAKILIGIATVTPDRRLLESLPVFYRDVCVEHDAEIKWVWNKPLCEAQCELGQAALDGNFEYLLMIEDDHWAFTIEMLEALIAANEPVCMIQYRSRHWPFKRIPLKYISTDKNGIKYYDEYKHTEGYHECDLIAFGFTLIKREVLEALGTPIFQRNKDGHVGVGPDATDIDFSERVKERGFRLVGCYNHILNHRDINDKTWKDFLVKGIKDKHSMYSYLNRVKNKAKEIQQSKSGGNGKT